MKRLPDLRRKVEHARATQTFVVLDPDEADMLVSAAEIIDALGTTPEGMKVRIEDYRRRANPA